jgi:hypothetical protein
VLEDGEVSTEVGGSVQHVLPELCACPMAYKKQQDQVHSQQEIELLGTYP